MSAENVYRIAPFQYIHVLDNNSNVTRYSKPFSQDLSYSPITSSFSIDLNAAQQLSSERSTKPSSLALQLWSDYPLGKIIPYEGALNSFWSLTYEQTPKLDIIASSETQLLRVKRDSLNWLSSVRSATDMVTRRSELLMTTLIPSHFTQESPLLARSKNSWLFNRIKPWSSPQTETLLMTRK